VSFNVLLLHRPVQCHVLMQRITKSVRQSNTCHYFLLSLSNNTPVPVAARSKAWVCWCSPVEIVGSNPNGGMDVCCECCVLSGSPEVSYGCLLRVLCVVR